MLDGDELLNCGTAAKPNGRPIGSPTISNLATIDDIIAEAKAVYRKARKSKGATLTISEAKNLLGMLSQIASMEKAGAGVNELAEILAEMKTQTKGARK